MRSDDNETRVLVIESEDRARDVLVQILGDAGYVVEGASDGEEGLFLLTQAEFQAVVLELVLEGMSGIEVFNGVRTDHPETKVVILTTISDQNTRAILIEAGAAAYLTKPCGADALLAALREVLSEAWSKGGEAGQPENLTTPPPARSSPIKPGVLVVDEDKATRRNVCRALDKAGYKAVEAASGKEALEKLQRGNIQVIILDIRLPGMDGFEVLDAISDSVPDIMPIVLSELTDYESVQAAMAGRAFDYLAKPCALEELLAAVGEALKHVGNRDEYTLEITYSQGKNILVVDDENNVRRNVVRFLEREGYDAVGASDGEEALFMMSQERFAVVVLDVKMPGLTGDQVLEQINADYPDTLVIVLTGLDPAIKDNALILNQMVQNGAYNILQKPCRLEELVKVIDDAFKLENSYWKSMSPVVQQVERLSEEDAWIG